MKWTLLRKYIFQWTILIPLDHRLHEKGLQNTRPSVNKKINALLCGCAHSKITSNERFEVFFWVNIETIIYDFIACDSISNLNIIAGLVDE